MARPSIYSAERILDSARELVLESGAGAATVEGITRSSGASSGSIYHRFGSRDEMLAQLWMRTVRRSQMRFLTAAASPQSPTDAAVSCALSIYDFASEETSDARLLLSLRRRDLVDQGSLAVNTRRELERLNRPIEKAIVGLADRIFGDTTSDALQLITLAVIDLPYGAIRRTLVAGSELPTTLRAPLERAVRAVLTTKGPAHAPQR